MNIILKRNYWIIVDLILIIIACFFIGSLRIISYNLNEGEDLGIEGKNYDNDIYLYDDSVIHEIEIGLSENEYEEMVRTYQNNGEKEYFRTYITIDGVTIPDVGVRLKGNLTLRQTLGGDGNGQEMPNRGGDMGNIQMPLQMMQGIGNKEGLAKEEIFTTIKEKGIIEYFKNTNHNLPNTNEDEIFSTFKEKGIVGLLIAISDNNGNYPPFLIKIDEFIEGQTYQGFSEIAVRLGSDDALLGELVAYYIHRQVGQIVPEASYAIVETAENEPSLYVICEHIDEKYIERNFINSDGILYKAGNFVGFEYLGEDPTLYYELFEQKTNKNDDDLSSLISFLKFVSESSDEEFESQLSQWLDIDSFIRMMALDNLLSNNDSFVGMGSNYYLYYDKKTKKFTMLSWDMNLAMGGMGGMMKSRSNDTEGAPEFNFNNKNNIANTESEEENQAVFEEWLKNGGVDFKNNGPGGQNSNTLKERFFANETFTLKYNKEYEKLKEIIFNNNLAFDKINELSQVFTNYNAKNNIIKQSDYDEGVETIKSFIAKEQTTLESE
jgi:spore coat protein CotH